MSKTIAKIMGVLIVGLMIACAIVLHNLEQSLTDLNVATEQLLQDTIELQELLDTAYPGWNEEEDDNE